MPRLYDAAGRPRHPAIAALKTVMNYDDFFKDEQIVRRAVASYYALVSFLDHNIGQVIRAIDAGGTDVVHPRDLHLRSRRQPRLPRTWGKSVMYEELAAIPLILAGAGVAAGAVVDTPVSLIDCYRTALEAVGCPPSPDDRALPSHSLWGIAAGARPDRTVLSEYHAVASVTGTFMIRHGRWKYIHHVGYRPELFDLESDPGETTDLAERPEMTSVLARMRRRAAAHLRSRGGERARLSRTSAAASPSMAAATPSWRAETMVTPRRPERSPTSR